MTYRGALRVHFVHTPCEAGSGVGHSPCFFAVAFGEPHLAMRRPQTGRRNPLRSTESNVGKGAVVRQGGGTSLVRLAARCRSPQV
jgi:hypothetical protein